MVRSFVVYIVIGIWSSVAFATALPDAGSILREQQHVPQLPERLPQPDTTKKEPPSSIDSGLTITVIGFRFTGINGMVSEAELQELVKGSLGKRVGLSELQELVDRVTTYLRSKGFFLAKAFLPKQDITDGIIEIAVRGGRVDGGAEIRIKQPARIDKDIVTGMFHDSVQGEQALHSETFQRSLYLLNDLPGIEGKALLERGNDYGTTRVFIDVNEGPLLSGGISGDTFGNRYTGIIRGTAFVAVNDPFGLGDQCSMTMVGAERLQQGNVAYTAQLTPDGLKGTLGLSVLHYKLGQELTSLQADGSANTLTAGLRYPLMRSRSVSTWTSVTYEYRMLDDYVAGTLTKDRDVHAATIDLSSNSYDSFAGGGLTNMRLALTGGYLKLGVASDAQTNASTAQTAGHYHKLNYSVSRLQRLSEPLTVYGALSGQLAGSNLDSSEKFILGGPSGVRSYPVGEASGDEGHSMTMELRYDMPLPIGVGTLQLVGFADAGYITLNKELWPNAVSTATNRNSYWLAGSGIGVDYTLSRVCTVHGSWARTIGDNPGRSTTGNDADNHDNDNRFWLQSTVWF